MNQIIDFFRKLLDSSDWPPRWHCGKWTEFHGWLYIISDLLIWSAYFTIPFVIVRYLSRKKNIQFTKLYSLFAAFILACGATHFLDAVAFWVPVYRLSALIRFITGVISWVTVFYLVKYLPVIFSLRSQAALEAEIDERKKTELALKKSRKDYELLIDGVKDYAIFLLDTEGRVASWNSGAANIKGYAANEVMGKSIDIFYTNEEIEKGEPDKNLLMALQHGRYETTGWRVRKDKSIFWADVVFSALYDEDNQLYGYAKVTRDITEKRKAEERIAFLVTIASNIQDPVIATDNNGIITRWNHAAELLLGWKAEEVVGKTSTEILKIDYLQTSREQVVESFKEKKYWQGEVIYHTKTGRPVNVLVTVSQLLDAGGSINGNLALVRDITERKKAEEKIKESEILYSNLFYDSPGMKAISDAATGKYLDINHAFARFLGRSKEEIIGRTSIELNMITKLEERENSMKQLQQSGLIRDLEMSISTAGGKKHWVSISADLIVLDGKNCFLSDAVDITKRKEAEDALSKLNEELEQKVEERTKEIQRSEAQYRHIFSNNPMPMMVYDLETFKILDANQSALQQYGYSREEFLAMTVIDIRPDEEKVRFLKLDHNFVADRPSYNKGIWRHRKKDGSIIQVEIVAHEVWFEGIKARLVLANDVTEQKETAAKLTASEMRFRMLIENSAEGIDMSDKFSNNIYRSPGALKITGFLPKENQMGFTHPDDLALILKKQEEMIKNPGKPVPFQARFQHALGHYLWIEGTLTNLLHVEGVHACVTNFRDVTQRKELEVLLHKANTLARIGGWELDLVKGTVFWSDITREIHETAVDYVPNLENGIDFYKEGPGRDLIKQKVTEAIELGTSWDVELQIITAKNNERWIRSIGETEFADGKCIRIYGSFQDITERKTAEIERERLNERLLLATQSAQLGLWDWDVKNNVLIWDEGMYKLYNLTENEFTTVYEGWASRVHPEDRQRVDEDIQLALAGEKEYNPEFRIIWNDGSVRYIKASGIIEKDSEGNLVRMTGFNWDVTERKTAEEKIKNINIELEEKVISRTEQLRKTNEELEAFSYSISHDLRAPLRGIIGFTNILEEDYNNKLDAEAKRITGVIKNNTIKMGNLIDDLLSFSRLGRQPITKTTINMHEMVSELILELGIKIHNNKISLVITDLPAAQVDPITIKQVWTNLISNAVKYSAKQAHPVIEIGHISATNESIFFVKDNGVGFDDKYKEKLFKVFQRLHSAAEFEGTGVGLAIVDKIISKHGGKVWAEGALGKGACFYFALPEKQFIN